MLARFTEFHDLEGAFGRRALTERAKGILMERHSIEDIAFLLLRDQSRRSNRKLIEVAQAVVDARSLLPGSAADSTEQKTTPASSSRETLDRLTR